MGYKKQARLKWSSYLIGSFQTRSVLLRRERQWPRAWSEQTQTISHQANIVSSVLQNAFEALIDNSTSVGEMLYLRHDVIRRRDSSCKGNDGDGNDNCTEDLRAQIFIHGVGGG